ncbi:MAG: VWA domain-containing protein [Thiohalomonadales bacterium]
MLSLFENFQFLRPWWLLAILPIIVLLVFLYRHRQSGLAWQKICDVDLLPFILTTQSIKTSVWPMISLLLAALLTVTALAGPVWQKAPQPAFRTESALVIILDLSLSMNARDIKPSRLERAKLKILDILRRRTEGQTALIVFSLESFTVSPLTQDSNTIKLLVPALTAELMPSQGSQVHVAIDKARELFLQSGVTHGYVLLVTDSGSDAQLEKSINDLTQKGHSLSILGVGTAQGAPIRKKNGGFVKDITGSIVITKLDALKLKKMASLGRGRYHSLSNTDADIDQLLSVFDKHQNAKQKDQKMPFETDVWIEQGPWLLLLLLPMAAIYFRRGWLMMVFVLLLPIPRPSYAIDWQYVWSTPDQTGQRLYNKGDPQAASKHFKRSDWNAVANYKSAEYEKSLGQWEGQENTTGLYNKGNALVKLGRLEEALSAYTEALKLDKDNADAIYNRDLVKSFLDQQKQDQQKQDGDKQDDPNKDGDSDSADKQQGESEKSDSEDQPGQQQDQQASGDQSDQDDGENSDGSPSKRQDETAAQADKEKAEEQKLAEQQAQQEKQKKTAESSAENDKNKGETNNKILSKEEQMEINKKEEQRLALEQWLRRVPDDPGGLLRRKFRYQAEIRGGTVKGNNPW